MTFNIYLNYIKYNVCRFLCEPLPIRILKEKFSLKNQRYWSIKYPHVKKNKINKRKRTLGGNCPAEPTEITNIYFLL